MSKYLHELCCSIIEDYYGEFYARIFQRLTHNGRFTAAQLAQKCQLPLKQIKTGLAALVQLRLIYHHTTPAGLTTYQANTKVTYDVIRIGKLINLARSTHGFLAGEIVTEASLLGCTTVAELQARIIASHPSLHDALANESNGDKAGYHVDDELVQSTIQLLIKENYLTYVRTTQFQTEFDACKDVELYLKNRGLASAKTRKAMMELEEKILREAREKQSARFPEAGYVPTIASGQKRTADGESQPAAKRQKLTNGSSTHLTNGNGPSAQPTTTICVNCKNVVAQIRNDFLAGFADNSFGSRYKRILRFLLDQTPVSDPFDIPSEQHWLNLDLVRDSVNTPSNGSLTNGHRTNGTKSRHHHDDDIDRDEYLSFNDLDRYLAALSESRFNFLHGGYSKGQWNIDQKDLATFAQQQEILRIMGNRLGPPSLRLIRMLMEKGRLDEKTLQEMGLLGAKDLRQTLAELGQLGFTDLQEVPREAQHQPNRTMYLWFHDPERVRTTLLEGLYKSMTRMSQRLRMERRGLKSTLDKVERSDVKGNEEQMLPPAELTVWKRWLRKEEWMLGELSRLDESVALLRDL